MKIAIAGTGYVGLSSGTLLAQHNEAVVLERIGLSLSSDPLLLLLTPYCLTPNLEIEIPQPQEIVKAGHYNRTF